MRRGDQPIKEAGEFAVIADKLEAAGFNTVDDVWRAVGKDRLKGIPEVAAKCGIPENQLVDVLFNVALADKDRAEISAIARHWADVAAVVVALILVAVIVFGVRQRPFVPLVVTASKPVAAFEFIDSGDVTMKPAWRARTAFYRVDDVVGRLSLTPLSAGQRLHHEHLGEGRLARADVAGRTVLPISVSPDQLELRLRAGQQIGITLSPKSDTTAQVVRFDATILHIRAGANPVLLVAVPDASVPSALAQLPHSKAILSIKTTGN